MGALSPPRRILSILNNDDHPSFAVRPKPRLTPSGSFTDVKFVRQLSSPNIQQHFHTSREDSPLLSPRTPPLLRLDSASSSGTMDSPSPATPIYQYDNRVVIPHDTLLRNDSTYTISPIIYSDEPSQYAYPPQTVTKPNYSLPTLESTDLQSYPPLPSPTQTPLSPLTNTNLPQEATQSHSQPQSQPQPQSAHPQSQSQPLPQKKNKYPCPYAVSHGCTSTFTTSGHAARHGKKHTGEKSVHCPVCGKAFTRKDNMKQHERTHAHRGSTTSEDTVAAVSAAASHSAAAAKSKDDLRRKKKDALRRESIETMRSGAVDAPSEPDLPIEQQQQQQHSYDPSVFGNGNSMYPALPADPTIATPGKMSLHSRPSLSTSTGRTYSDLDTLAMAASGVIYDGYMQ